MIKRVQWVQFPVARSGSQGDDEDYSAVVAGELSHTVYSGAVLSRVIGGAGDLWLRVELYRAVGPKPLVEVPAYCLPDGWNDAYTKEYVVFNRAEYEKAR